MQVNILIILANIITAALCMYLAHAPEFRPISWVWYGVLTSMSILNAAFALINTVRMFSV